MDDDVQTAQFSDETIPDRFEHAVSVFFVLGGVRRRTVIFRLACPLSPKNISEEQKKCVVCYYVSGAISRYSN